MITERRIKAERRKLTRISTERRKVNTQMKWSIAGVVVSYIALVVAFLAR